jgi:hypothetical protein
VSGSQSPGRFARRKRSRVLQSQRTDDATVEQSIVARSGLAGECETEKTIPNVGVLPLGARVTV